MRVLIVTNYKADNRISYFVSDQVEAIAKYAPEVQIEVYGKRGSGFFNYLKNRRCLLEKIRDFKPDIIHAHYGFCGALACMQRGVPVITTFHGSDINKWQNRIISNIALVLSKRCIFVSKSMLTKVLHVYASKSYIIPCGISTNKFYPMSKDICREKLGIKLKGEIVLFPAAKDNNIKNYPLAKAVVDAYNKCYSADVQLMELDGYRREDVAKVINAADVVLMTSFSEGSPQVIKEAIACGCPIVSVPIGDVEIVTKDLSNAFVSKSYKAEELIGLLQQALCSAPYKDGAIVLQEMGYENETIAKKIVEIYKECINGK